MDSIFSWLSIAVVAANAVMLGYNGIIASQYHKKYRQIYADKAELIAERYRLEQERKEVHGAMMPDTREYLEEIT